MKTFFFFLGLVITYSAISMAGTFDNQPRTSEACEAFLYAQVDKQLPQNQFVSQIRMHPGKSNQVDLEITLDQGNENFCLKTGTAIIHDENNGVCEIQKVEVSKDNFDCG